MKIAFLGDTHFGARNDNLHFHDFFDKFYSQIFFPYLKEQGITNVVQLGDVFDRRKFINFNTLAYAKRIFFDKAYEYGITITMIVGNHDTYYKNTNEIILDYFLN